MNANPPKPVAAMRVRVTYAKEGAMRYTGHLDLQRVWERILRRSRLPVAYSQGFHPQVRLNLASALPLGMTSQCEVLDFWLYQAIDQAAVGDTLLPVMPPGLTIRDVQEVDLHTPALQILVRFSDFEVTFLDPVEPAELAQRVRALLAAETLPRQWRQKDYDLRPLIQSLEILPPGPTRSFRLTMRLSSQENANARPEEVISALGFDPLTTRIRRTALIFVS
jgi:radical SAM-linked protein